MSGQREFDVRFSQPQPQPVAREVANPPLRILVLADLSGSVDRHAGSTLPERYPVRVDAGNFDSVLSRIAPRLTLKLDDREESRLDVALRSMADFHPDSLLENLDIFQALRGVRKRLMNRATFQEAAAELGWREAKGSDEVAPPWRAAAPDPDAPRSVENDPATLQRLLGRPSTGTSAVPSSQLRTTSQDAIRRLIKDLVAPYIVPAASPDQSRYVASVERAIGDEMRKLLHHRAFQALESTWRGVQWLVNSIQTPDDLEVYLLDIQKDDVRDDLLGQPSGLSRSYLYNLLVDSAAGTLGGQPWSLLVGLYSFGLSEEDLAVLQTLGALASQARSPFLAAADPTILGCQSLCHSTTPESWKIQDAEAATRWQMLRTLPGATWIGLALPRFLLRLPYGKSDPVRSFDFEELPDPTDHEAYLWGQPALACAQLIASAFQERGWAMRPGDCLEIGDLPVYTFSAAGETAMKPCAEVYLSHAAAEAILSRGVMPLLSHRNRDAVRLARFQSIADPPQPLSGRW